MCINTDDIETVSALSVFRDAIKWREVGYTDPKNFNQYGDAQYQPVYLVEGGQQLPITMANALSRPVAFGKDVRSIDYEGDSATVTCLDGSVFRAGRIIVAVPMVTLRNIDFRPPLPPLLPPVLPPLLPPSSPPLAPPSPPPLPPPPSHPPSPPPSPRSESRRDRW